MLPRLQAEESLLAALRTSVGTGAVRSGPTIVRGWQRAAGVSSPAPAVPQMFSPEVMGLIGMRRVSKKKGTTP